jgi:hypothetical protein
MVPVDPPESTCFSGGGDNLDAICPEPGSLGGLLSDTTVPSSPLLSSNGPHSDPLLIIPIISSLPFPPPLSLPPSSLFSSSLAVADRSNALNSSLGVIILPATPPSFPSFSPPSTILGPNRLPGAVMTREPSLRTSPREDMDDRSEERERRSERVVTVEETEEERSSKCCGDRWDWEPSKE